MNWLPLRVAMSVVVSSVLPHIRTDWESRTTPAQIWPRQLRVRQAHFLTTCLPDVRALTCLSQTHPEARSESSEKMSNFAAQPWMPLDSAA